EAGGYRAGRGPRPFPVIPAFAGMTESGQTPWANSGESQGGVRYAAVPPTVRPSMRTVGWPTPTRTPRPALPQGPTPASGARSLRIIVILVSAWGPLPISVAPLTAGPTLPFSIR